MDKLAGLFVGTMTADSSELAEAVAPYFFPFKCFIVMCFFSLYFICCLKGENRETTSLWNLKLMLHNDGLFQRWANQTINWGAGCELNLVEPDALGWTFTAYRQKTHCSYRIQHGDSVEACVWIICRLPGGLTWSVSAGSPQLWAAS